MINDKYPVKKDKVDSRDYIYKSATPLKSFPLSIDLRPKMSPIVDQGQLGSCTANAMASGLREYQLISGGLPLTRLSRLFLYWHERFIEGTVNEDSGAYVSDGMKTLCDIGVPPESEYPYMMEIFTNKPSDEAEQDATKYKISEYHRVLDFNSLQQALVDGNPVVLGFTVYDSFESAEVASTGIVPTPDTTKENLLGGHCVIAAGYKQINGETYIIIRNSWSDQWADGGYCYFPKSYWDNGIVQDMWVGTTVPAYESIDFPQATNILSQKKIFLSPDFWINLYNKYIPLPDSDFRYVGLALRRFAAYASFSNTNLIDQNAYLNITFQQALDILVGKNVISSPDFWINLCTKYDSDSTSDFKYVSLAFRKMASYIQGL